VRGHALWLAHGEVRVRGRIGIGVGSGFGVRCRRGRGYSEWEGGEDKQSRVGGEWPRAAHLYNARHQFFGTDFALVLAE
jgi:hypothetical protein